MAADLQAFDLPASADVPSLRREHFAHRLGWVVHDAKDLLAKLDGNGNDNGGRPGDDRSLVLAFDVNTRNRHDGPGAAFLVAIGDHR